jgi:hypothetical protein
MVGENMVGFFFHFLERSRAESSVQVSTPEHCRHGLAKAVSSNRYCVVETDLRSLNLRLLFVVW